ncbi:MAG: adenylate/guanylate cyclase domain-containing protein [Desulfosarcinaceae bacterium]|nr:adenylate/guanylate cyclase domain-containing protein [Desulfosarcinaceae bacterium]
MGALLTRLFDSDRLWLRSLLFGALVGLVGVLSSLLPVSIEVEERFGLAYLFKHRGAQAPPDDVMIVSIDRQSSQVLSLPPQPEKWPRRLHAHVVDELKRQGAAVIAFDMIFDEPRSPSDDHRFAQAIARAGNVVLCEYLDRERLSITTASQGTYATVEKLVRPIPLLAEAAVGLGPFPLPKVPVQVSQYWTFKTGAGDLPTLPVVAYHLYARDAFASIADLNGEAPRVGAAAEVAIPPIGRKSAGIPGVGGMEDHLRIEGNLRIESRIKALRRRWADAPLQAQVGALHRLTRSNKAIAADAGQRSQDILLDLYQGPDSRHLNFYGPPGTLKTVSYHEVLAAALESPPVRDLGVTGKAVFIGQSENLRLEQVDGFYTVFSSADGLDLSGVEIAASAFANLVQDSAPWTLGFPWQHLLLLTWGGVVGLVGFRLRPLWAMTSSAALGGGYLFGANTLFAGATLWLPLVVPLLLQLPLAFVCGLLVRLGRVNHERDHIRTSFGYYLPPTVADQLATDLTRRPASNEVVHGTCLFTDAERYTALSERLAPDALIDLMNRYCEEVFAPIERYGGMISDIKGDSILSIWATRDPDKRLRRRACAAALEIQAAVARFNAAHHPDTLPTRIGLHTGLISLCSVGARNRFEYSAVGDIVNTASRIENLNKFLRTRVLVSADVLDGLDGFLTREAGAFIFAGKSKPVHIHELIARRDSAEDYQRYLCDRFAVGLKYFRQGRWLEARRVFDAVLDRFPEDGPSQVFQTLSERYRQHPPEEWDGVVQVTKN